MYYFSVPENDCIVLLCLGKHTGWKDLYPTPRHKRLGCLVMYQVHSLFSSTFYGFCY